MAIRDLRRRTRPRLQLIPTEVISYRLRSIERDWPHRTNSRRAIAQHADPLFCKHRAEVSDGSDDEFSEPGGLVVFNENSSISQVRKSLMKSKTGPEGASSLIVH